MSAKFDVIVVGAGPAGLTAAYKLASAGFKVLVVERGREPGSKQVYGGRIYAYWLDKYLPEFRKDAPTDRWVRKERVSLMDDESVTTLEFEVVRPEKTSFVTSLTSFTSWLGKLATAAGAKIVTEVVVDELLRDERGRFIGVRSGSDKIYADYVVDAEGVNRLLLERAGVVSKLKPELVAIGAKEVLKFENRKIMEDRLGLSEDEGLAWAFAGWPTEYLPGGAFLYTYRDSVALGVVLYLTAWRDLKTPVYDLAERFRTHPYIAKLVAGTNLQEYSAHLTPVAGLSMAPPRFSYDGLVVVGDAAGFLMHAGVLIRGVDFAVASGALAAEAIKEAGRPDALSRYDDKLKNSFIIRDLAALKNADKVLSGRFAFGDLPRLANLFARNYFTVEDRPPTVASTLKKTLGESDASLTKLLINMLYALAYL
ncbi:MAG: FAD-dependent oxidoreductase [Thermoproteus sp.]